MKPREATRGFRVLVSGQGLGKKASDDVPFFQNADGQSPWERGCGVFSFLSESDRTDIPVFGVQVLGDLFLFVGPFLGRCR